MNAADWSVGTLKEHLEDMLDERERRQEDRFTSRDREIGIALQAQERLVAAALVSQEKAGGLVAQQIERVSDKLSEVIATVVGIQQQLSRGEGGVSASDQQRQQSRWLIGLIVVALINMMGLGVTLIHIFK